MPEKAPKDVWKRVLLLLALVYAGLWMIEPVVLNIMSVYFIHDMVKKNPGLAVLPSSLADSRLASTSGWTHVTIGNLSFLQPSQYWHTNFDRDGMFSISFGGEAFLLKLRDTANYADSWKQNHLGATDQVVGQPTISSNYKFATQIMNTLPGQGGVWHTRATNARVLALISMKAESALSAVAIYPISFGEWKGYQVNSITSRGMLIHRFLIYDSNDNGIDLTFGSRAPTTLSQPELNAIIESLQQTRPVGCVGAGCS